MTVVLTVLAAALGAWMAWRGWRRGVIATVIGWLSAMVLMGGVLAALRLACLAPAHFMLIAVTGCVAAAVLSAATALAIHRRRARVRHRARPVGALNRAIGALVGVVYAAMLCLGLACVGSAASFAIAVDDPTVQRRPTASDQDWAALLRKASRQLADVANIGVLRHVPGIAEYSREAHAMVTILNTPRERLARLAEERGFTSLLEVPEVRAAIDDHEYMKMVARAGRGNLSDISKLARSETTKALFRCKEIRELARTVRPSDLVKDLDAFEADREQEEEPAAP